MNILNGISDYFGIILLALFALIVLAVIARIIYKAVKYPKQGEATKMVRDVMNIWDPITGVPRSMVGKEEIKDGEKE